MANSELIRQWLQRGAQAAAKASRIAAQGGRGAAARLKETSGSASKMARAASRRLKSVASAASNRLARRSHADADAPGAPEPATAPPPNSTDTPPGNHQASRQAAALLAVRRAARYASPALTHAAMAIGGGFLLFAPQLPDDLDLWNVNRIPSVTLLDSAGEPMAGRGAFYGDRTRMEELPAYVVAAFLATEDRRFFDHSGLDLRGVLRAALVNLRAGSLREGGSTITQQLAKNLFLSGDRTLGRKLREAFLALWIEGRLEKPQILSLYLNRIYLGDGAFGVDGGARRYFDKPAREVTLAEAAMLAGLPKAPSAYAPSTHLDRAQRRADAVLENMVETGALTALEALEARVLPAEPIAIAQDAELGYFLDYAAARAVDLTSKREKDLVVQTTLDRNLQDLAEEAVSHVMDKRGAVLGAEQAALVALTPDGAVRAMVGGRAYRESQFNRAVQAERQPGSAFKVFLYLAALEAGLTSETKFVDGPIDIGGWRPVNYDEDYRGEIRLVDAVALSVNTVAVQVSEQIGRDAVIEVAQRLGVQSPLRNHPSLALGASEVTLLELTGAFAPLAAGGRAAPAHGVARIDNREGERLFEFAAPGPERVASRRHVRAMNHLLFQVLHNGTGRKASLSRRPAAGKTGTSQDWRDAWFVGYTPQLIAGVWVGNDDHSPMEEVTGGDLPAEIWRLFMLSALSGEPVQGLPGAYPAVDMEKEEQLRAVYAELESSFERARRKKWRGARKLRDFLGLD